MLCEICGKEFTKGDLVISISSPLKLLSGDGNYSLQDFYGKEKLYHIKCKEIQNSLGRNTDSSNDDNLDKFDQFKETLRLCGVKFKDKAIEKFYSKHKHKSIRDLVKQWFLET